MRKVVLGLTMAGAALFSSGAKAQDSMNLYCSVQVEWCQAVANAFTRKTNIRVNMTQKGSGETLAQIRAEASNPRGDVWFGGTGDPHLVLAEEGLSDEYRSSELKNLHPWAVRQAEDSKFRTVGIYAGILGIGYNPELLKRKNAAEPKCWADLVKPQFKDEIQVANPASSGTAYVAIATLVQLMGEDQAFDYLKRLHANVNAYPRSGTGPIKAVARGETGASISFMHDAVTEELAGLPAKAVAPCEGTGIEVGSMSIIKGSRNPENARKFFDWALTPEAQRIGADVGKQFQTPSNRAAPLPERAPRLDQVKLIDYDFAKYGKAAERRRLIERWEREVGSLPR